MAAERRRHPKEVERALRFAEENGWTIRRRDRGHSWGVMVCAHQGSNACRVSIWSTPKNPGNHANRLEQRVRNCPHRKASKVGDEE
jgi:ribosomal protein L33